MTKLAAFLLIGAVPMAWAGPAANISPVPVSEAAFISGLLGIRARMADPKTLLRRSCQERRSELRAPNAPGAAPLKAETVRVSGAVHLTGTAWVDEDDSYAVVNFTGRVTVRDPKGELRGTDDFVFTQGITLYGGSYVWASVTPTTYVSLYKNGAYVGKAYVSGPVDVSGNINGDELFVSGSGVMSGSVKLED